MTTFVVIPRTRSPEAVAAALSESAEGVHDATVTQVRQLLERTEYANRPLYTERGMLALDGTVVQSVGDEGVQRARGEEAPRVLSSVGAVLIEDPSEAAISDLSQVADVVPNIAVPLVSPYEEGAEVPNCDPWHLDTINVRAARDQNLRGRAVRIGVLDTGIDANHAEFAGKDINFAEFDDSGFLVSTTPRDAGSHGTHVAGLAAGRTCGVAPDADLAVAAVLTYPNAQGLLSGYLAQILGGLNWIAHSNFPDPGMPISRCPMLNASLGGSGYNDYLVSSLQTIRTAPAALLVAAIGNAGYNGLNHHGSPGNYDITCGIGATDANDDPAGFSDWGVENSTGITKPDMSAPGVNVCSAIPGGGYAKKSGTSMAAPIVAGAAALIVEKYPVMARNPQSLFNRLMALTDPTVAAKPAAVMAGFNRIGRGRLDLTNL